MGPLPALHGQCAWLLMVRVLTFAAAAFHAWGLPCCGGNGSVESAPPVYKTIPGRLSTSAVEIGEGNDALEWQVFPGSLSDAQGSWPAIVVPKDPPPVPTAEKASYLACSVHHGQLMVAEIIISSKDGKVYAKQGMARVLDGYNKFEGDLRVEANYQYPSMSPSYELNMIDLLYKKFTTIASARQGENLHLEIKVPYPESFCKNETVQKAWALGIAEITKVPGATARMNRCTPKAIHSRRLDSVQGNVDADFTVFMAADQASQGSRQLTDSLLSDLSDAVSRHTDSTFQINRVVTPQGNLGGTTVTAGGTGGATAGTAGGAGSVRSVGAAGGAGSVGGGTAGTAGGAGSVGSVGAAGGAGSVGIVGSGAGSNTIPFTGHGSMPGALGVAVQQGFRGAIHSHDFLGKYSRGSNLASQGSGVGLLATWLGLMVLIAAVVKRRWAGEQAEELLQQGDVPLAGEE